MRLEMDRRNFLRLSGKVAFAVGASGILAGFSWDTSLSGGKWNAKKNILTDKKGVKWKIEPLTDTTAMLTGYDETGKKPSGSVTLPSKAGRYTITEIKEFAFTTWQHSGVQWPVLDEVTELTIPASIRIIGMYAFDSSSKMLKKVEMQGVEEICGRAFGYLGNLTEVIFSNNLETINGSAFEGCTALKEVDIPASVACIGSRAFYYCENLEKISLKAGLETIYEQAFTGCASLKTLHYPETVVVTGLGQWEFSNCVSLTELSIPKQCEYIGSSAFYNCSSLKRIFVPASVKEINENASIGSNVEIYYGGAEAMWKQIVITNVNGVTTTLEELFENNKIYYNCDDLSDSTGEL